MGTLARRRIRFALILVGAYTVYALLPTAFQLFHPALMGMPLAFGSAGSRMLITELTGAYFAAALFPLLLFVARRRPPGSCTWRSWVPPYLAVIGGAAGLHRASVTGFLCLLLPLAGLGRYHVGNLAIRLPLEAFLQAVHFAIVLALIDIALFYRSTQERELHVARLESQLHRANLDSLQARLHPHFLFNTLNAISSLAYRDPAAADRLTTRLSDLLRLTLAQGEELERPLDEEVRWLETYLEIMRERFGERLVVRLALPPDTADVLVPTMALQPLVENAIRHGVAQRAGRVRVAISALLVGERLQLHVRDDGPGLPPGGPEAALRRGLGLQNTAARLRHLYGDDQRLEVADAAGGGVVATVEIPVRRAGSPGVFRG